MATSGKDDKDGRRDKDDRRGRQGRDSGHRPRFTSRRRSRSPPRRRDEERRRPNFTSAEDKRLDLEDTWAKMDHMAQQSFLMKKLSHELHLNDRTGMLDVASLDIWRTAVIRGGVHKEGLENLFGFIELLCAEHNRKTGLDPKILGYGPQILNEQKEVLSTGSIYGNSGRGGGNFNVAYGTGRGVSGIRQVYVRSGLQVAASEAHREFLNATFKAYGCGVFRNSKLGVRSAEQMWRQFSVPHIVAELNAVEGFEKVVEGLGSRGCHRTVTKLNAEHLVAGLAYVFGMNGRKLLARYKDSICKYLPNFVLYGPLKKKKKAAPNPSSDSSLDTETSDSGDDANEAAAVAAAAAAAAAAKKRRRKNHKGKKGKGKGKDKGKGKGKSSSTGKGKQAATIESPAAATTDEDSDYTPGAKAVEGLLGEKTVGLFTKEGMPVEASEWMVKGLRARRLQGASDYKALEAKLKLADVNHKHELERLRLMAKLQQAEMQNKLQEKLMQDNDLGEKLLRARLNDRYGTPTKETVPGTTTKDDKPVVPKVPKKRKGNGRKQKGPKKSVVRKAKPQTPFVTGNLKMVSSKVYTATHLDQNDCITLLKYMHSAIQKIRNCGKLTDIKNYMNTPTFKKNITWIYRGCFLSILGFMHMSVDYPSHEYPDEMTFLRALTAFNKKKSSDKGTTTLLRFVNRFSIKGKPFTVPESPERPSNDETVAATSSTKTLFPSPYSDKAKKRSRGQMTKEEQHAMAEATMVKKAKLLENRSEMDISETDLDDDKDLDSDASTEGSGPDDNGGSKDGGSTHGDSDADDEDDDDGAVGSGSEDGEITGT